MESKTGALLTKIAAIINLVIAGLIFVVGTIAILAMTFYQGIAVNLFILISLFFIFSFIIFLSGILLLNASKKMKTSKNVKNGAIWALVIGVLTMKFLTGILALIGGIIALVDSDKKK